MILFFVSPVFAQNVTLTDSCISAIQKISAAKVELKYKHLPFFKKDTAFSKQTIYYSNAKESPLMLIEIDSITKIIVKNAHSIRIKQNTVEKIDSFYALKETPLIPYSFLFEKGKDLEPYIMEPENTIVSESGYLLNSDMFKIQFPENGEFTNMYFQFFVDKISFLPHKIVYNIEAPLYNSQQITETEIHYMDIYYDHDPVSGFIDSILNVYHIDVSEGSIDSKDIMPNFHLKNLSNDTISLYDIKSRFILLEFWHLSCKSCLLALKDFAEIDLLYSDTVLQILGINAADRNSTAIKNRVDELGVKFEILRYGEKISKFIYKDRAYPKIAIIDTFDYKIIFKQLGYSTNMKKTIQDVIEKNRDRNSVKEKQDIENDE